MIPNVHRSSFYIIYFTLFTFHITTHVCRMSIAIISTAEDSIFPRDFRERNGGEGGKYPLFAISLKDCPGTSIDFHPPSIFNFALSDFKIKYIKITLRLAILLLSVHKIVRRKSKLRKRMRVHEKLQKSVKGLEMNFQ